MSAQRPDAESIQVWIKTGPGGTSYHEREGCFGAHTSVDWSDAVDGGLEPCRRCASSFTGGDA